MPAPSARWLTTGQTVCDAVRALATTTRVAPKEPFVAMTQSELQRHCKVAVLFLVLMLAHRGRVTAEGAPAFQVPTGQRQLFLDDYGVAETNQLVRTMHRPEKRGAVIWPERPWEASLQTRSMPAWDEAEQVYKLWMITSAPEGFLGGTTYAESMDGTTWTKPDLGLCYWEGSYSNNFLCIPGETYHANTSFRGVVCDRSDPDPNRRYKGFQHASGGLQPMVSPDGVHWQFLEVPLVPSADESNLSHDTLTGTFIATVKQNGPYGRAHGLSTSTDFEQWTAPELIFSADALDQERGAAWIAARFADPTLRDPLSNDPAYYNVDVYNLGAFRYEGLYVGLPAMFHATGPTPDGQNTDGFHLVQLICSRDLRTWMRLGDRATFIGPSPIGHGAYDLTQLLPPSAPVVRGDELWFYYTGIKYRVLPPDADPNMGAVCLAVLRRDGFISLDAGAETGYVRTEPFRIPGGRLFVNIDATGGELRAEIVTPAGSPIEGFRLADCIPVTGDRPKGEVTWQGDPELGALADQDVRLRFTLREGSLYSYWFEDPVPPSSASTIYHDSFTRSDLLNGSAPDVVNAGGAIWTAATGWNTYVDGTTAKTTTGGGRASAYLPFMPSAGFIYTLSMDLVVDETYDANSWLAFGFAGANSTTAWPVDNDPWFYDRNVNQGTPAEPLAAANALFGLTDAGVTWKPVGSGVTVPHTLAVILDTTTTPWTAEFRLNGSTVGTDALDTNPPISYVGFSVGAYHKVAVDDFRLSCSAPTAGMVVILA